MDNTILGKEQEFIDMKVEVVDGNRSKDIKVKSYVTL